MMKRIIVGRRRLEIGQSVTVGQDLIDILSLAVWITANVKEIQLARLRPGQSVEFKIDAWGALGRTGATPTRGPALWLRRLRLGAT
jgi:membrane fusion protein (multidrug efflux system)